MRRTWLVALGLAACGDDAPPPTTSALSVTAETDGEAEPPPCKITIRGREGTPSPTFGDAAGVGETIDSLAFGVTNRVVARRCSVRVPLAPGEYDVTVSRGPEHDIANERVTIGEGASELHVSLPRRVDSSRFACGDLHVHSAPSFDSDVPLEQRLLSAASEGLDLVAPTDHDVLGAWEEPHMAVELDAELAVMLGNEITPDHWTSPTFVGHIGVFPVTPEFEPTVIDQPGLDIERIVSSLRALAPTSLVQLNHPRWDTSIGAFDAALGAQPIDVVTDANGDRRFDVIEVWNAHELDARVGGSSLEQTLADWYSVLGAGVRVVGSANSDTHRLALTTVGYPRTCVAVANDGGDMLIEQFVEGLRRGDAFGTSGPFVSLTVEGERPGGVVEPRAGVVRVEAQVEAAPWVPVDRVRLVVGGEEIEERAVTELPATITFDAAADHDTFVLVLVSAEVPLPDVTGDHGAFAMPSFAFTNPVFVDADGDGEYRP